jgi:alpha-L-rhamnosidase
MKGASFLALVALAWFTGDLARGPARLNAQAMARVQWIWFNEGDPAQEAPAEVRYFRRVFTITCPMQKPIHEASLDITANDEFTVWVNGVEVGKGDDWKRVYRFDVQRFLIQGDNLLAVAARNKGGNAGLLVRLSYVPQGLSRRFVVSDAAWKASKTVADGWQRLGSTDATWSPVKMLGVYGRTERKKGLVALERLPRGRLGQTTVSACRGASRSWIRPG